jgi:transformation/transcription domain-associated protein
MERVDNIEDTATLPSDPEMDLWENRWVDLQKELCQLEVVADYASASGDPHLLLDSSWKLQDWERLRSLCASPSLADPMERGDPTVKMTEILLAVNEGKLSEVENLHAQTAQLSLQRWQLLPTLAPGSQGHGSLLHFFHRLVELRESGQIMVETGKHSTRRTLPDLKNLLT